jgi:hypothetical protein
MKPFRFPSLIPILLFLSTLFVMTSCRENINKEISIPDFKSLADKFKSPPADYTTCPFFVWNADITNDEIDRFLTDFRDAGSYQVFIHPRPGLITEYLSDRWFMLFKHAVEKGKELGMKIWIYDENSYPSGFAGGHVPAEMPESYNQGQGLRMTRCELLPDTCEKYFLCLKEKDSTFTDITDSLSSYKDKEGEYLLFSKSYNRKSDWYGGYSYIDLLYPGVTQKFIEVTMDKYEKYLGPELGKTIPGTFADEPQINSPGGIRWTPDLFDIFHKQWQYDLKTHLPSLFEETGDWKKIRHDYTQTLLQMFIDRWAKIWYAYSEEKGLIFTGHYWEHEWPNMRPGGDNMAMYAWHQMPGIDMLFNQWDDSTTGAQFGNVRSVKELASAANQTGRNRKLSETYGGSGWDLSFTDMKRNGDWEFALGVNFMNQHLTYFSMTGARKYDYPPTFDYHEPWWKDYRYINDHFARLSVALSSGRQENNILVIEPTTSSWLYDSYVLRNSKSREIGQSFQTFITTLEKKQVEYDLGSENIIKDLGSISGKHFIVGQADYTTVVIPPMTENLDNETYKLLKRFVSNGGKLLAFSVPTLVDGSYNKSLKKIFENKSVKVFDKDTLTPDIISGYFVNDDMSFDQGVDGTLYHMRRKLSDGQVVFLANADLENPLSGSFTTAGVNAIRMNTFTGELTSYPSEMKNGKVTLAYSLPPAGSILLFIPSVNSYDYPADQKYTSTDTLKPDTELSVKRDSDNVLMIDFCDLSLAGNETRDMHVFNATDKVFKSYGFKNGNPWNTSVQYKTNITDRDTFGIETGFTVTYHFIINGKIDTAGIKAVVERPGLWSVSVNNRTIVARKGEWWLDRSFGVYRIGKYIKTGDNTLTLKISPMSVYAEIEPAYIVGDFSVKPAAKGWIIEAPLRRYSTGSWLSQGLPFYSWGMTYSREYQIKKPDGRWKISLGKWNGTVAEVKVNGQQGGVIAFPPYDADITPLIHDGNNRIEVTVIGSLRNLLGPHHNNPPKGFVSPWSWRNVKTYPPGKEYSLINYGLSGDFTLVNEKQKQN